MGASIKNILIGLFVIFAFGVIAFMLLFLHPSVGDNKKTLMVRFTDIDKVNVGTRVTYAGRPVGEVVSITEIPEARTSRLNQNGEVYIYELTLKVDSGVDVYNTDDISLRTSGLLGERNIEIDPRPLKPGQKLERVENQVIFAATTSSVETTLKQFQELSTKFGVVLDDFHTVMSSIQESKVIDKLTKSVENVQQITDSLNKPDVWRTTLDNMHAFSEHINRSLNSLDDSLKNIYEITDKANKDWVATVSQALESFKQAGDNVQNFSVVANQIIENTQAGQGTIGQLFVGNDMYLRTKSILFKGSTIMDDINQYGVLFHLDKRWQRRQARRMKFLEKLSCPEAFRQYFDNEVSEIQSSLSRVAMLLNETDCYPQSLMCDPDFTTKFGDLLKRVELMEEALQMYNEQVNDQE